LLFRAARQVLLAREIDMADGTRQRWLAPDFRAFRAATKAVRHELPPMADPPKAFGNRLMVELADSTLAANVALREMGVAPPAARALVADIGWVVYARMLSLSSLPFRLTSRRPENRLKRTIGSLLLFPFTAPGAPGYAVDTRIEGDAILTHFTHCPPQTRVRQLTTVTGDAELLAAFRESWCRYDWPGADLIAGDGVRGHYRRRQTLSHGDPVCDMCWSGAAPHCVSRTDHARAG
jgi:hypothetical protein